MRVVSNMEFKRFFMKMDVFWMLFQSEVLLGLFHSKCVCPVVGVVVLTYFLPCLRLTFLSTCRTAKVPFPLCCMMFIGMFSLNHFLR